MKIKHFANFDNSIKTLNWEKLRNDESEKNYFLPFTKEEYLSKVNVKEPNNIAKSIIDELETIGLNKVFSIGSGIASLEYQLKTFSDLNVVVSDYNSPVIRLKEFDVFDNALKIDALRDKLPVDQNWVVLFPRIDTEFEDQQLTELFAKCHQVGVKHICFIPAELLSLRIIAVELKILLNSKIKRKPRVFCGYARSLGSFKAIWGQYYKIAKKQKAIIFLESIS